MSADMNKITGRDASDASSKPDCNLVGKYALAFAAKIQMKSLGVRARSEGTVARPNGTRTFIGAEKFPSVHN
jgi:hypothetical protein